MQIPQLHLSFGQVLWALSFGEAPQRHLIDKVNYLRKLGIPFPKEKRTAGSGNRVHYSYYDLIECGVAYHALMNGMKPKDIVEVLAEGRASMHSIYAQALEEQPDSCLTADWVKSKGRIKALQENEIFLRLHDRYAQKPNSIEVVPHASEGDQLLNIFDSLEQHGNQIVRNVPLTHLAMQWTYWALQAPELRTGPKA